MKQKARIFFFFNITQYFSDAKICLSFLLVKSLNSGKMKIESAWPMAFILQQCSFQQKNNLKVAQGDRSFGDYSLSFSNLL
ncbi:hypothetical protein GDO86_015140 [Hymenochirus boettgeri]|uniref:Uncharacterized protein n=1 Tax=Hymenochirus boettgeri TaxID=247094 RepID=A0A8T2JRP8_9PIPI|nr:hypothetical protein GDO86_015140 [Hymenochirus boettgeri]